MAACLAGLLAATLGAAPVSAQSTAKRWSAHGSAGVQFDDNVTTAETDTTSNKGDTAAVFELGGSYRPAFGDRAKLEVGYDFSQSLYEDLDDFDLQSHTVTVGVEHEASAIDFGLNYLYGRSLLGGDDFLSLHSITPTAGFSVSNQWYASLRYSAMSKDFLRSSDEARDGWNNSLTIDNFVFFGMNRSYVSFGYKIEDENTDGPQFDYLGHFFHARLKLAVPVQGMARLKPTFQTGIQYSLKDYDHVTPSIGERREDKRKTFNASLTVDITDPVFGTVSYEYIDSVSNLPTADYDEQIVTVRLGFKF